MLLWGVPKCWGNSGVKWSGVLRGSLVEAERTRALAEGGGGRGKEEELVGVGKPKRVFVASLFPPRSLSLDSLPLPIVNLNPPPTGPGEGTAPGSLP